MIKAEVAQLGNIVSSATFTIICFFCQNPTYVNRADVLLFVCPRCGNSSSVGPRYGRQRGLIYLLFTLLCLGAAVGISIPIQGCSTRYGCPMIVQLIVIAVTVYILLLVLAGYTVRHLLMKQSTMQTTY